MVELYRTVNDLGIGYAEASTQVKRRFIGGEFGESYAAPYYWAPFVFYGQ
jgi:CHAT domain-containing protein